MKKKTLGILVASLATAGLTAMLYLRSTGISEEHEKGLRSNTEVSEKYEKSEGIKSPSFPNNLGELTSKESISSDLTLNQYSNYKRQVLAVTDKDKEILLPCPLAYTIFKQREASLKGELYRSIKAEGYRRVSEITMANYSDMTSGFKSGLLVSRGFSSLSQEDKDIVFSALYKHSQACLEKLVPAVLKDIYEMEKNPGLPLPDYLKPSVKGPLYEEEDEVF